jgi:hypothetical protein
VAEERDNNALCSIIRIEAFAETNYQGDYLSIHQALLTDLWNFANTFRIGSVGESVSGTRIEDDDTSWVTVVGALGASGGAVGIAAKTLADRARKKTKTGEKKKNEREDEEAIGYILQISQDHLRISQDQPASLEATVWEVNRQGGYKRATNADLSIEQPANTNFLNIAPRQAQGTLNTNLSIAGNVTNPSFQLNVVGRANGTSSSAKVNVEIESEIAIKIETSENRRSLRADGKDGLNVYACLVAEGEIDEKKLEAAQESLEFSISGAGASWLETSEKTKEGEWQTIYIQASKPQGQADSQPPPADVQIIVNGKFEGKDLTATISISLVGEAALEYQPDSVNFLLGAGEKSEIKLWINPPGDDAWDFSYVLENESLPVEIDTADEENTSITIIVLERGTREPELTRHPGGLYASGELRVFARQNDIELEKRVSVGIYQEGLFVDTQGQSRDGTFHLMADGKHEPRLIDFRLLVWNPEQRRLEANPHKELDIEFSSLVTDEEIANALEVGQLRIEKQGMEFKRSGMAAERYRFWIEHELLVDGRIMYIDYLATTGEFFAEFTLGVETTVMPVFERMLEMQHCQLMITKFVPGDYQIKMQEIFDKYAPTLGPEGLYQLRLKIWNITQLLILGEGGQGYLAEGNWAARIETVLEWTQWAGDHCFNAVISLKLGPTGRKWAPVVRNLLIDCINAGIYEKKTPLEWALEYIRHILAQLTDIKALMKRAFDKGKEKGFAWLQKELENRQVIIVGSNWRVVIPGWVAFKIIKPLINFMERYLEGKSLYEAAKMTAWEAADDVIANYIGELVVKKGDQDFVQVLDEEIFGSKDESLAKLKAGEAYDDIIEAYQESGWTDQEESTDEDEDEDKEEEQEGAINIEDLENPKYKWAVEKIKKATKRVNGKLVADKKAVLEVMQDLDATRTLKNAPREIQEAFANTREQLYQEHDEKLVKWAQDNLPQYKGKRIVVGDFRTPGADGLDLGTDRDYRLGYIYADPVTGKEDFIEIEEALYQDKSYQIFAETAENRKFTMEEARHYTEGHGQLAAAGTNPEASPDFSDQGIVWVDEKGRIVEDPDAWRKEFAHDKDKKLTFRKAQVGSNITKVHGGKATLKSANGLGLMYETKVQDSMKKGAFADAYAQAAKGAEQLRKVRAGYEKQGYDVGEIPPKVEKVMDAINKVKEEKFHPASIARTNALIKELKLGNDINDFTKYLSSNLESVKLATKK